MITKQYSKPEVIKLGDAVKITLGLVGDSRDWFRGRRFRF